MIIALLLNFVLARLSHHMNLFQYYNMIFESYRFFVCIMFVLRYYGHCECGLRSYTPISLYRSLSKYQCYSSEQCVIIESHVKTWNCWFDISVDSVGHVYKEDWNEILLYFWLTNPYSYSLQRKYVKNITKIVLNWCIIKLKTHPKYYYSNQ